LKKKRLLKRNKGILFVISGPSGAGKTTLYKKAISVLPNLKHSVSFTTRSPRTGEVNDRDYTFIDKDEFMAMVRKKDFAEWAGTHGELYGTSKRRLKEIIDSGVDAILDIDVQGAKQLREEFPGGVYIFVLPPSLEVLRERLEGRMANAKVEIEKRLKVAVAEMKRYGEYDYVIVNHVFDTAFKELESIIIANRARTERIRPQWIKENFFK
jgi:guanylate kinase